MINLDCTGIAEVLDWALGVNVFEKPHELLFSDLVNVLDDTLHLLEVLKFVRTVVEEKLGDLEVVVWDFLTEELTKLLLHCFYLRKVFIIEPARYLHLALVALLQVYR